MNENNIFVSKYLKKRNSEEHICKFEMSVIVVQMKIPSVFWLDIFRMINISILTNL